jgi:hypothetical protein
MLAVLVICVCWTCTHQNVFAPCVGVAFNVESNEVLGKSMVQGLVHFIKDEVEEVEVGNEHRWDSCVEPMSALSQLSSVAQLSSAWLNEPIMTAWLSSTSQLGQLGVDWLQLAKPPQH